jgi:hypothetical protein
VKLDEVIALPKQIAESKRSVLKPIFDNSDLKLKESRGTLVIYIEY